MTMWLLLTSLVGGLGLFLLGMSMMTDGLKLAAGPALERVLMAATRTRVHALGSGMMVTALVQSSSAVTVAAIGFINAGLLSLGPALWVLFGSNVGSTMTGWIVALVGMKFKIDALAMPFVGIGVIMKMTGEGQRRGAVGTALAGFGLLFLGIAMLQQSFTNLAGQIDLPQGEGFVAVVTQVGIGAFMTVVMQSSAASMAIALTAAQGGLLSLEGAAAVVIGANIGTTATAVMAAIGATPNARRAASAHVIFNVITATVALALLPWLLETIQVVGAALGLASDPAAKLALFHTIFNILGVLLMWPLAKHLTRWLQQRFRAREEDEGQPQFLDDNVLQVPSLAVEALVREVARIGHVAVRMARATLAGANLQALKRDLLILSQLDASVEAFVGRMSRAAMSERASKQLAEVLRVQHYHDTMAELVRIAAPLHSHRDQDPSTAALHSAFFSATDALFALCDPLNPEPDQQELDNAGLQMEASYEDLKAGLLASGAIGHLRLTDMEETLRRYSALRRAAQQASKARRRWPSEAKREPENP